MLQNKPKITIKPLLYFRSSGFFLLLKRETASMLFFPVGIATASPSIILAFKPRHHQEQPKGH